MTETSPLELGGVPPPRRMGPDRLSPGLVLLTIAGLGLAQWGLEHVFLPGLDYRALDALIESLGEVSGPGTSNLANLSVVSLGILPYLSAAFFVQMYYVLVRQLGGSTVREAATSRANRVVLVITLVVALFQAYFIARYLDRSVLSWPTRPLVVSPGIGFRVPAMCAMVAGTFLLLVLANVVTGIARVNGIGCLLAIDVARELFTDARVSMLLESLPQFMLVLGVCSGLSLVLIRTTRPIAIYDGGGRNRVCPPTLGILLAPAGGAPLGIGLWLLAGLQRASITTPGLGVFSDSYAFPSLTVLGLWCLGVSLAWPVLFRMPERASEGMRAARLFLRGVRPGAETEARMKASWMRPTLAGAGVLVALSLAPALLLAIGDPGLLQELSGELGGAWILVLVAMGMELYRALQTPADSRTAQAPAPPSGVKPRSASTDGRCPACSVEVVDGFAVCWSCGGPVTPIAPLPPPRALPEAPAGGGAPTTIARMTFPIDAEMARLALDAEGIPVRLLDVHLVQANWFLAVAVGGIRVQVPAECAAVARDLLFPSREPGDRPETQDIPQGPTS